MKKLFSLNTDYSSRVYGLDVFRALAIIFVVMGHGGFLLDASAPGFPYIWLIDGVELFFVLSGFLIGSILFKLLDKDQLTSFKDLLSFWQRRWFRTLPAYYLVLALNVIFISFGFIHGSIEKFSWKFIFFLHNFSSGFTDFFWESWSLSIEEWFYIFMPLGLLLTLLLKTGKQNHRVASLIVILIFIITPLLYRFSIADKETDAFWYDVEFRKVVITRLDAIVFGVLFAWLKFYHEQFFKKSAPWLFAAGLTLVYLMMYLNREFPLSIFSKTIYFSATGLGAAMLLPLADSIRNFRTSLGKVLTHISVVSYSMYLINLSLVAQVIQKHFYEPGSNMNLIWYFVYWAVVVAGATLLYKFFEKPVMDLRESFTKKVTIEK